jgi:hypothetical protein
MGDLATTMAVMYPGAGHEDEFVFNVRTHEGHYKKPRACRDDRDINQHFLRPAAKALGVYWIGFGFHAFRREAVTEMAPSLGTFRVGRLAGHSKPQMSMDYKPTGPRCAGTGRARPTWTDSR